MLTQIDGRVGRRIGSIHQVDASQIFVRRHDVDSIFARYVHEVGQTGAATDEDTLKSLSFKFFDRDCFTNDDIRLEVYAHLGEIVYFHVDYLVGQSEFGYAILQHTAYLVQCLEDIHVVSHFHHIAGKAQSCRTAAYNSYLDAIRRSQVGQYYLAALTLIVGSKALQVAYGHGFRVHLQVYTLALTLFLLRTYTTADGG